MDGVCAVARIEATIAEATAGGQGIAVTYAHWAAAMARNSYSCG